MKLVTDQSPVITKVEIIMKQSKLEELKIALNEAGVASATISNVLGYGNQKGKPEYYRGAHLEIKFHSKIKIEVVVCKVPVVIILETTKSVLYSGHMPLFKMNIIK